MRSKGCADRSSTRSNVLGACRLGPVEVDRANRSAGFHTGAMRLAAREIDLVGEVDRILWTGLDARVAASTDLKIDRIDLLPLDFELAQIPLH